MSDALARLLEGVIDYAGLFPPAKLSMADSVAHFLQYRSGSESWIVDRFAVTAARLDELRAALTNRQVGEPIPLTIIGTAGTHEAWGDALVHDAESMTRFIERVGDAADIEAYEIRIPRHENLGEYISDLRSFNQVDVYCELPWSPAMADSLGLIAEQEWLGVKARTGGLEAAAFPDSKDVAVFLQQCVQLEVQFKLTAGLHHPFRAYRDEVQTKMHGFLNVTTAISMLVAHDLSAGEVTSILESEDPSAFSFKDGTVGFGEWTAGIDDIDDARDLFVGFGSCSVQEPLDDLRSYNLI